LYSVENSIITHNNFNNSGGILIEGMSHSNKIINNNFIKNKRDAIERLLCFNNLWDGNYWDKWIGFKYKLPIFQRFPHIILFAIDWHPALEPYDI
jgi:nitrous oxidase accessory protein NosD